MKIPWKAILKVGGGLALGVASVMSAYETSDKVQDLIKKGAEKVVTKSTKES